MGKETAGTEAEALLLRPSVLCVSTLTLILEASPVHLGAKA